MYGTWVGSQWASCGAHVRTHGGRKTAAGAFDQQLYEAVPVMNIGDIVQAEPQPPEELKLGDWAATEVRACIRQVGSWRRAARRDATPYSHHQYCPDTYDDGAPDRLHTIVRDSPGFVRFQALCT
jgi:hypothetical protein